jgi:hypothetical protein
VVLAKFAHFSVDGEARPGDTIRYKAVIQQAKDFGASVVVKGEIDGHPFSEADIFFARFDPETTENTKGRVLFNPEHLRAWLQFVGVFDIGVHADGTRIRVEDYPNFFKAHSN